VNISINYRNVSFFDISKNGQNFKKCLKQTTVISVQLPLFFEGLFAMIGAVLLPKKVLTEKKTSLQD